MEVSTANVKIWGKDVGVVAWWPERNCAVFEYHKKWLDGRLELSPMHLSIKKGKDKFYFPQLGADFIDMGQPHAFRGLPGLLADSLPDAFGIMVSAQGSGLSNTLSKRLADPVAWLKFVGEHGLGALTYHPADGQETSLDATKVSDIYHELQALLNPEKDITQERPLGEMVLQMAKSAAGARPKIFLAYDPETCLALSPYHPNAAQFRQYIVKLDTMPSVKRSVPEGYTRVEMAYYHMAKAAGIEMMPSQLLNDSRHAHFMTERFDRPKGKPRPHVQSLQALQHLSYLQHPGVAHSYETLFQWTQWLKLPANRKEQLFRRMVFNVLAHNTDDHTRNHAFMMYPDGKWDLTPAYDLVFISKDSQLGAGNHSLSINSKLSGITLQDFAEIAEEYDLRKWRTLVQEVKDVVADCGHFLELAGVPSTIRQEIIETTQTRIKNLE